MTFAVSTDCLRWSALFFVLPTLGPKNASKKKKENEEKKR